MLGEKPGLLAIFDETGPVFITAAANIARETRTYAKGGYTSELRTLIAIHDLGAAPRNAEARAKSGPLAERINKAASKMRYRVAPAPASLLENLANAFTVVADPRLNGPTARANQAIDALP